MTNFEKWRHYMSWCPAPDNFINFGFYYLIAAALQRRVWTGPDHSPLFPNIFVVPTGPPGVGKGLVIKQITKMLKHHKKPDPKESAHKYTSGLKDETHKMAATEMARDDYQAAQKTEESFSTGITGEMDRRLSEKPLLFPVASETCTFEALIEETAAALRRMNYVKGDGSPGIYMHSSICFSLEECSSLFRKHTNDLVNFLMQAYDCGDYKYSTKTKGKTYIKNCCLNFYGGTTPDFMQEVYSDRLLTQGFSSRAFFIYANKNRFRVNEFPDLTADQQQCYKDLLAHIEKLAYVFGRIDFSQEAKTFLDKWWVESEYQRPNTNPKLDYYYSRKNIHLKKLSVIRHFGETTSKEAISIDTVKATLAELNEEEKRMHLALGFDTANPLVKVSTKVLQYLRARKQADFKELSVQFWEYLPNHSIEEMRSVVEHLEMAEKIGKKTLPNGKIVYVPADELMTTDTAGMEQDRSSSCSPDAGSSSLPT